MLSFTTPQWLSAATPYRGRSLLATNSSRLCQPCLGAASRTMARAAVVLVMPLLLLLVVAMVVQRQHSSPASSPASGRHKQHKHKVHVPKLEQGVAVVG